MIPETVSLLLHFQYGCQFGFSTTKFELRSLRVIIVQKDWTSAITISEITGTTT